MGWNASVDLLRTGSYQSGIGRITAAFGPHQLQRLQLRLVLGGSAAVSCVISGEGTEERTTVSERRMNAASPAL